MTARSASSSAANTRPSACSLDECRGGAAAASAYRLGVPPFSAPLRRYVENLLRKYITEYVKCHMCNSLETELHRDAESRLFFLNCKSCGSQRSVAPIKAGFHATARGERKKAREAT